MRAAGNISPALRPAYRVGCPCGLGLGLRRPHPCCHPLLTPCCRFELLAPLQALRQALLRTLGSPECEAGCLLAAAAAGRKAARFAQAATALHALRALLDGASGAPWTARVTGPGGDWRVEEAKLLWAQGQESAAVQLVNGLLQGLPPASKGADVDNAQRAHLLGLAAKWLAHSRRAARARKIWRAPLVTDARAAAS